MNLERINYVLDEAVLNGDLPGVCAAVTDAERTLVEACAGTMVLGGGRKVDANTLFWIASMTKPVTSIAAMQLVEQGKLALDAPIGDVLPELAHPQILENGALRPAQRKITLRHLLTHTSGFSYDFASVEYARYIAEHNIPPMRGVKAALNLPLLFEPGERWEYSISTDWVGLAVEAISGKTLDVYFNDHIFGPLGMADTTFLPDEAQNARRAAAHQRQVDGSLVPAPIPPTRRPEFVSGGGGLFSTLADYQKFLRMILQKGAGIVSPETIAEMSRNQIGGLRAGYIPSANPAVITGSDFNPGQDSKWGLGFLIFPERGPFGRNAGSLSWAGLPNCYFWIDPAAGLAAIMLAQVLPSGDAGALKTYFGLEKAVYAAPR